MPATRTKYQHLTDAPLVAIEEGMAMANDIIDFLQNQEAGRSMVFHELKAEADELVHHPVDFFKSRYEKAKSMVERFTKDEKKK